MWPPIKFAPGSAHAWPSAQPPIGASGILYFFLSIRPNSHVPCKGTSSIQISLGSHIPVKNTYFFNVMPDDVFWDLLRTWWSHSLQVYFFPSCTALKVFCSVLINDINKTTRLIYYCVTAIKARVTKTVDLILVLTFFLLLARFGPSILIVWH